MTVATPSTLDARRARQQRRRDRSRDDILAAARAVVLRDGIASATLDAVAREAGMSKAGLYYYFPSKEALIFQLAFDVWESQAQRVNDAVAKEETGAAALGAIIQNTVRGLAGQIEDFRLAYLHYQTAGSSGVRLSDDQFERIRPLNDLLLGGATAKISNSSTPSPIEPRLLAFLAFASSLGVLTMKGLVEQQGDPLLYTDEQLIDALSQIFAAGTKVTT